MIKKLLSILAAAVTLVSASASVFAEDTTAAKTESATFMFDTDKSKSYLHTFGNANDTNLTCIIDDKGAYYGRSLKLTESFKDDVSNQYGGIYFDANDFGISDFSGYTMTLKVKVSAAAAKAVKSMALFSDGVSWTSEEFSTSNASSWTSVSITVPADTKNTKLGITIPITTAFTGDVAWIDEVTITDNYGTSLPNVGDIDTSIAKAPGMAKRVITTIVFVVLAVGVIGAVVLVVLKMKGRFR